MGTFSRMSAPSKFTVAKVARYVLPFVKPLTIGLLDLKDGTTKELLDTGLDLFGEETGEKIKDYLKTEPDAASGLIDEHLVRHTGAVLGTLVKRYAKEEAVKEHRAELLKLAKVTPGAWAEFLASGELVMPALRKDALNRQLSVALDPKATAPAMEPTAFVEFFRWLAVQKDLLGPLKSGLTPPLTKWITKHLNAQLLIELCRDTPEANAAFKESVVRFLTSVQTEAAGAHREAKGAHQKTKTVLKETRRLSKKVDDAIRGTSADSRLAAYKRSLLAAFRPYQELALDNYAAGDQACPDIWDIFVHPACSKKHLRPEDMDAAQMEKPPRLPAADLLPLLAQDDHRRTVLLADPGMGKSTLIQSLIAHLASGRSFTGAAALTGLLPIPLILRDLVPLLPHDQVESWTWDSLLTVLLEHYQREETAPPLCEAYKGHEAEFRQLIHSSDRIFFLIDGLDEIGDLAKRRTIVQCIQDGMLAVNKEARWLITSRVIGYENAPVEWVKHPGVEEFALLYSNAKTSDDDLKRFRESIVQWQSLWLQLVRQVSVGVSRPPTQRFRYLRTTRNKGLTKPPKVLSMIEDDDYGPEVLFQLRIAQRLHLAPFDDKRQDTFTSRWFRHRHSTDHSRELMREVRAHHHDGVRIISRVPNLLCMMNMLKRSGKPLPDGRAALYDEIVKAYLGGIDSAYKFKPILGHTCPFETAERRHLLSLLGAHMQQQRTTAAQHTDADNQQTKNKEQRTDNDSILISVPELQTLLLPAIEAMQSAGKVKSDHSAAALLDELLHHIASRSGLLIPRSTDAEGNTVYGFTHLSFLEFFAAEWLGKEFDRQRNRIVRRSLALAEGQTLTEADLDHEFPPQGPVQHTLDSFKALPATPAWHEPLIFLLESRKADASTLLRWLLPALHAPLREPRTENSESRTPLLPLEAVALAIQLAHDQELALPPATRQSWWRTLWAAYLAWPHPPWHHVENRRWPIAPLLLGAAVDREESLRMLAAVYPQPRSDGFQPSSPAPADSFPHLYLSNCPHLTATDLRPLTRLLGLKVLYLNDCTGLEDSAALAGLPQLETLSLWNCTGLKGRAAWQGLTGLLGLKELFLNDCTGLEDSAALAGLPQLEKLSLINCTGLKGRAAWQGLTGLVGLKVLYLNGCTGLEDTSALAGLRQLETLDLSRCTGLKGRAALQGLTGLLGLKELWLYGCTGLTREDVEALRQALGKTCQIYGR